MNIFDKLFRRSDPTRLWPPGEEETPPLDLSNRSFGALRFGDDLEAARFLGRPDSYRCETPSCPELMYASRGFRLDYEQDRFTHLTFFIGRGSAAYPGLVYAQPRLTNGLQLTRDFDRDLIVYCFGEPRTESRRVRQEHVILTYVSDLAMEFELNDDDRLIRWELSLV